MGARIRHPFICRVWKTVSCLIRSLLVPTQCLRVDLFSTLKDICELICLVVVCSPILNLFLYLDLSSGLKDVDVEVSS